MNFFKTINDTIFIQFQYIRLNYLSMVEANSKNSSIMPKFQKGNGIQSKVKKKCELKAREQNCSLIEKIKYHCAMNELENAFIEVCAPVYRIHGNYANLLIINSVAAK